MTLICCLLCNFATAQYTFNKQYDYYVDASSNVIETNDGYISAISAWYNFNTIYLVVNKVDKKGDTVFQKVYGVLDNDNYEVYTIQQVEDSNYIIGTLYSDSTGYADNFLIKVDKHGDSIWMRRHHAPQGYLYFPGHVNIASNGDYLIASNIMDSIGDDVNGGIAKYDSSFNLSFITYFGGIYDDNLLDAIELPDHSIMAVGWTRSYGFGNPSNRDIYLVKTDSAGNLIWQKTFGNSDFESANTICPTLDGNYIVTGGHRPGGQPNPYKTYLIKVDTAGKKIWEKTFLFSGQNDCHRLRELANGDLIGCGVGTYNGQEGGLIFNLDSTGKEQWHRLYTVNSSNAIFRDIRATTDGGFICAGFAFVGNSGNQDALLVKVDSLGCDSAGCPLYTAIEETTSAPSITNEVRCNPNPCGDFAHIHTRMLSIYGLVLFDINGREVAIRHRTTSHNSIQLDTSVLTVSIYVAKILTDGGDLYVRVVKGN
ncbi:MAG TPA: hypothetical protein PK736_00245 [Bacteroidia bacterium]|nr:hypothetical protein [Bacteroidia bacterium]